MLSTGPSCCTTFTFRSGECTHFYVFAAEEAFALEATTAEVAILDSNNGSSCHD